jgi:hypothetical protein
MVKAYYRYEHALQFGVIASPSCNVCCDTEGQHLYTGALENVNIWNVRTGEKVRCVYLKFCCWPDDFAQGQLVSTRMAYMINFNS